MHLLLRTISTASLLEYQRLIVLENDDRR